MQTFKTKAFARFAEREGQAAMDAHAVPPTEAALDRRPVDPIGYLVRVTERRSGRKKMASGHKIGEIGGNTGDAVQRPSWYKSVALMSAIAALILSGCEPRFEAVSPHSSEQMTPDRIGCMEKDRTSCNYSGIHLEAYFSSPLHKDGYYVQDGWVSASENCASYCVEGGGFVIFPDGRKISGPAEGRIDYQ